MFAAMSPFKRGDVIQWYGKLADIPGGWALCNGSNGTPDMRNKFVYGGQEDSGDLPAANGESGLANAGGSKTHNHIASQTAHTHILAAGVMVNAGANWGADTNSQTPAITVQDKTELPPWRALYYIMKL